MSTSDPDLFLDKNYQLLTQINGGTFVSADEIDYREMTFAPGTNGVEDNKITYVSSTGTETYSSFITFAIKIVMTSTNTVSVPKIRDLRIIALPQSI